MKRQKFKIEELSSKILLKLKKKTKIGQSFSKTLLKTVSNIAESKSAVIKNIVLLILLRTYFKNCKFYSLI